MGNDISKKQLIDLLASSYHNNMDIRPLSNLVIPPAIRQAKGLQSKKRPISNDGYSRNINVFRQKHIENKIIKENRTISLRVRRLESGRTIPTTNDLSISQGKDVFAAILFFDIVDSKNRISKLSATRHLYVLNLIIYTVSFIVRQWNGIIENNTGDGIMAVFGSDTGKRENTVLDAIETAVMIKHQMEHIVNDLLTKLNLPHQYFRIGVEAGETLISKIGIKNYNFITAIGEVPARADQLQDLANKNGICVGENVYNQLNDILKQNCIIGKESEWTWQYKDTKEPYNFYHYSDQI